ncbi:MAG TPA: glycosyltransferase [Candidatus Saccharimonadales bacterium]|nr:glycosyltransferase [Candidatus Saccharimonadales bacterium]
MSKPLVSVCLITYNHAKYIREAIDSVLAQQTNFSWELVIADDCSTDGTREIVREYQERYPERIQLILQDKNVGAEQNWLDLINYPKAKYMAYLEGDDYWTNPNKLQMQADFLEKHPDYALCFHPTRVFYESYKSYETVWPNLGDDPDLSIEALLRENFIPSNSVLYRRQHYDQLPRGMMPGDWYLHAYQAQFGEMGYIPEVMSAYRRHEGGAWWDWHENPESLWARHGLAMLALRHEFMKLYGAEPRYRRVIEDTIAVVAAKFAAIAQKGDATLLREAVQQFPAEMEQFTVGQVQRVGELEQSLVAEAQRAQALSDEIVELRAQIFRLRDELHALKNARLLGRIIKIRDAAGNARKRIGSIRRIPHRILRMILHRIRVIIAPLVPAPARRFIKRIYRKFRSMTQGRQPVVKKEWTTNLKWRSKYPLLTVVMPYYNLGATVDDALDSLAVQTYRGFEVIIVNDGSNEQTSIEKLHGIEQRYGGLDLRVIHQKNKGVAEARNTGMKQAHGKYIVCLDSDDMLEPTYLEKCLVVLEGHPDIALATAHQQMFGVTQELFKKNAYNPFALYHDNMVLTAAVFRRRAWEVAGGFLSGIGYEDWEFWIRLAEHGFWGRLIPEALFRYRTALQSRYVGDKDKHWNTIKAIRTLHPDYRKKISHLVSVRGSVQHLAGPASAFTNLANPEDYLSDTHRPNVLITIPWMTFGGAETLIYNYCREVKDAYNLSFVTGLQSEHEWEYKFKEITPRIYHLTNLFDDERMYMEFISNYIKTRHVDILHVIHNGFTFAMLETLKARHPKLKVIVTMFNDRVEYFEQSTKYEQYVDIFVSDNQKVTDHYKMLLNEGKPTRVIPNGINCYDEFNPRLFDREARRKELGIVDDDLAVFFVGRLSTEKNPDVFLRSAATVLDKGTKHIEFFVIGDGPMRPEIDALLNKIDNKHIHYLGYQAKVAQFLCAADVFVLPSAIEGFPLSILEAMAMQAVVIASDVGAVAQVVESGKSGFVVTPGSADEIVESVLHLIGDKALMQTMKRAARQEVEAKYSNLKLGENYRRLYKETLAL